MKILLTTFYYKPDLCAGSFRMTALVDAFKNKLGEDDSLDILTTMPNRYASFSVNSKEEEQVEKNIFIKRIVLPKHKSGFIDQARAFTSFFLKSMWWVRKREYDIVISTSSRLFTGFLGAMISKRKKIPLYLDIRDIFTDTMDSILPGKLSMFLVPFLKKVEKITFNQAAKINMVSVGFKDYINSVTKANNFNYFTNGIDPVFLEADFKNFKVKNKTIICYAGNIGKGQGLEKIIPEIASNLGESYIVRIVGDGGARETLEKKIREKKIKNVEIMKPVNRDRLIEIYRNSDLMFLHLNDYEAFKKVLPSKVFEYALTGKPILAGVSGYAAEFIKNEVNGAIVFNPCDINDFLKKFNEYNIETINREKFIEKYNREKIMDEMAEEILSVKSL